MDSDNFPGDINLVFKGVDGAEAESFISSVIRTARGEGKARDNDWIVDLASSYMRGEALRWYIELDEDTQNDWKLLRRAILRQYPSSTLAPVPSLQPTIPVPAAAATPPKPVSSNQSLQAPNTIYRIRVYLANTKSQFFLSTDTDSLVHLTSSVGKALRGRETQRMLWLIWLNHKSGGQSPASEE
ncbi:hypothetical protein FRC00_004116, partial [Tulasnella sp. 408]